MKLGVQYVSPLWLATTRMLLGPLGIPVIGVVSSAWILGEPLTPGTVMGLILILMGVLAVSKNDSNQVKVS